MFERDGVAFQAKTKFMNLVTGANRLITWKDYLFTILNKNVKSQLCTANSKNSLRVDGVGTVGNISDVKYWPDATTVLISISKLGEVGFRVSFEDEEGSFVIRRKSDNAIECVEIKENRLYWIVEEHFLYLAHVNLDCRTNKAHLDNLVASFGRNRAARLGLRNLVRDVDNYFSDYSSLVKDEQATCNLAFSNHKDMLEPMHDRTGHGNKSMPVECAKSKLVTGLKISENHIRYF